MDELVSNLFKKKLVETLRAFDEFCSKNGLEYFACSGTAIGAVRHKGFIPWDDDIDVYMLRKDYDRLIDIRTSLDGTHYRIAELGDEDYIYPFAKFYDNNTTLVETKEFPSCRIGVYIDIFALDEVSDDLDQVRKKKFEFERLFEDYQLTFIRPSFYRVRTCLLHFDLHSLWRMYNLRYCSKKKKIMIRRKFIDFEKEWKEEKGPKLFFHHAIYRIEKEIFEKEWFNSSIYMPFEECKVKVSAEYDKYLTRLFGDYMTPPPVEKRIAHHPHFYLNLKEGLTAEEVKKRVSKGEYLVF